VALAGALQFDRLGSLSRGRLLLSLASAKRPLADMFQS
jgi:hypothetical protein